MTLKGILFGACACGMLILATSASAPHKTASSGLNVGDVLPKMKSLDVGKHTLLSEDNIRDLITIGRTPVLKGLTSKAGKKFNARLVLKDDYTTTFEFEQNKKRK